MKRLPVTLAAIALLIVLACKDNTPVAIRLDTPSLRVLDTLPHQLGARLVNGAGVPLSEPRLSYSATPSSLLRAGPDGSIACANVGEGTVVVAGGGQSASMTVRCDVIGTIEGPETLRLVKGREEQSLSLSATDLAGREVADVPFQIVSNNPSVVALAGAKPMPLMVGKARITVSAGRATREIPVTVVELLKSEPLALRDGASTTITLQQGKYELDLSVKPTAGGKSGVAVAWIGEPSCGDSEEAQTIRVECEVRETASLTVRNPSAFGLGSSVTGYINLYRAPR